jgi:biotin transport system substrate-specific component
MVEASHVIGAPSRDALKAPPRSDFLKFGFGFWTLLWYLQFFSKISIFRAELSRSILQNPQGSHMKALHADGQLTILGQHQGVAAQALSISALAVLTAIGAHVEIPHQPVPFTLQTFFVLLAGALLGKRNGALSQMMYLAAGLAGLPVFSSGALGLAKLIGPTGGYLLGFPVAAFVVGYLLESRTQFMWALLSMCIGALVIFSLGTLHLYFVYYRDWSLAIANGFFICSWWDLLKIAAAAGIYTTVARAKRG